MVAVLAGWKKCLQCCHGRVRGCICIHWIIIVTHSKRGVFVYRYKSAKAVFVVDCFVLGVIPVDGVLLLFASLSKLDIDQTK